jgi:uncharacterized integral membrane protein
MFFVILILFLLFGSALTIVTIQNLAGPYLHVAFFIWQTPPLPVGLIVLLAFLLGALLLYLVSVLSAWRDRREIKRLRKRVGELEQHLAAPMGPGFSQPGASSILPMPNVPMPPQG